MIRRVRTALASFAATPAPLRWALPIGWAALLWYLSSRPAGDGQRTFGGTFLWNGAHVVAYFVLCTLLLLALDGVVRGLWRRALAAAALAAAYGVVDEFHQSMVPGRDCSTWDMASDALGAMLAALGLLWIERSVHGAWLFVIVPLCVGSVAMATL